MENIRFFEDLFFKLHFFTLSGLSVIAAYLLERKVPISLTVLSPLILITLIILIIVYETDRKHVLRMRRLVRIQDLIGLGGVYGVYKNNITVRAVVFFVFLFNSLAAPTLIVLV